MAYNAARAPGAPPVALQAPYDPRGAGFAPHVMRNVAAMSGIRVLATPCGAAIDALAGEASGGRAAGEAVLNARARALAADFLASILAAAVSMPFNQVARASDTVACCF